jgi:hypothetical protein
VKVCVRVNWDGVFPVMGLARSTSVAPVAGWNVSMVVRGVLTLGSFFFSCSRPCCMASMVLVGGTVALFGAANWDVSIGCFAGAVALVGEGIGSVASVACVADWDVVLVVRGLRFSACLVYSSLRCCSAGVRSCDSAVALSGALNWDVSFDPVAVRCRFLLLSLPASLSSWDVFSLSLCMWRWASSVAYVGGCGVFPARGSLRFRTFVVIVGVVVSCGGVCWFRAFRVAVGGPCSCVGDGVVALAGAPNWDVSFGHVVKVCALVNWDGVFPVMGSARSTSVAPVAGWDVSMVVRGVLILGSFSFSCSRP